LRVRDRDRVRVRVRVRVRPGCAVPRPCPPDHHCRGRALDLLLHLHLVDVVGYGTSPARPNRQKAGAAAVFAFALRGEAGIASRALALAIMLAARAFAFSPPWQPPSQPPLLGGELLLRLRHLLAPRRVLLEAGSAEADEEVGLAPGTSCAPCGALEAHLAGDQSWSSPWRSSEATCTLGEGALSRSGRVGARCLARAGAPIAGGSRRGSIFWPAHIKWRSRTPLPCLVRG
jgi:hypothetical protein